LSSASSAIRKRGLATTGGVKPAVAEGTDPAEALLDARARSDGVKRQLRRRARGESSGRTSSQRSIKKWSRSRSASARDGASTANVSGTTERRRGPPGSLGSDQAQATQLFAQLDVARREMAKAEAALAQER